MSSATVRRGPDAALWLAMALMLAVPAACEAGDAYFVLVFGSQRIPNDPNYSHSFATFVRTCGTDDAPGGPTVLEAHTISWLPETAVVRTLALHPECGRNFELAETLDLVLRDAERVSLWGPYQIEPELYERALARMAELASGQVRYKANDAGRRSNRVSNCIHAISAIAQGLRLRVASPGWGEVASFAILQRLRPWILDREQTHDWVAAALGLDAYPLIYRDWRRPVSGAILGPGYRLLGGERDQESTFGPPAARAR